MFKLFKTRQRNASREARVQRDEILPVLYYGIPQENWGIALLLLAGQSNTR